MHRHVLIISPYPLSAGRRNDQPFHSFGSSAPMPHTVRPPSAATAQTAAIAIILNVTMHRFILNHLVHDCLRQRRFGRRLCLSLTATITVHTSLLRRLQSAHSIWQFSATVLPPFAQVVMWSACISSMASARPRRAGGWCRTRPACSAMNREGCCLLA